MSDMPERIWATVNGLRTGMPGAHSWLIGGWESRSKQSGRETGYVRADLFDAVKAERDTLEARVKALTGERRQIMAAYGMAVDEAFDESGDEARKTIANWFAHWMMLDHPSGNENSEHSGDCTKQSWSCLRCIADKALEAVDAALAEWDRRRALQENTDATNP